MVCTGLPLPRSPLLRTCPPVGRSVRTAARQPRPDGNGDKGRDTDKDKDKPVVPTVSPSFILPPPSKGSQYAPNNLSDMFSSDGGGGKGGGGGNRGGGASNLFTGGFFGPSGGRFDLMGRLRLLLVFWAWCSFMSVIVSSVVKLTLRAASGITLPVLGGDDEGTSGSEAGEPEGGAVAAVAATADALGAGELRVASAGLEAGGEGGALGGQGLEAASDPLGQQTGADAAAPVAATFGIGQTLAGEGGLRTGVGATSDASGPSQQAAGEPSTATSSGYSGGSGLGGLGGAARSAGAVEAEGVEVQGIDDEQRAYLALLRRHHESQAHPGRALEEEERRRRREMTAWSIGIYAMILGSLSFFSVAK